MFSPMKVPIASKFAFIKAQETIYATAFRKIGWVKFYLQLLWCPKIESSGDWKRHRQARPFNVFIPQASVIHEF